ncbi:MAG: GNAT family N-acetyltransferase [Rhizomicrobium sp.]
MRDAEAGDVPFLRALFGSARPDAQVLASWPAQQRELFLDDQFRFQSMHYRRVYEHADFLIVEREGKPVGRLILDRRPDDWRIVDISLLPQSRGRGLGTALLRAVQREAVSAGAKTVSLSVENANPARALYARLGFVEGEDGGTHLAMAWPAVS